MKCPHCGMIFSGISETCPLCGSEIEHGSGLLRKLRTKTIKLGKIECNLGQLLFVFAVNLSLIVSIINVTLDIVPFWAIYPIIAIFTLYFVFSMLIGYVSFPAGLRRLTILHFAGASVMQFFCIKGWGAYGVYLPIFLTIADVVLSFAFFYPKTRRTSLFFSALLIAAMSVVLFILYESEVIAQGKMTKIPIVISFSVSMGVLANYSIYMFFCLKNKMRI